MLRRLHLKLRLADAISDQFLSAPLIRGMCSSVMCRHCSTAGIYLEPNDAT